MNPLLKRILPVNLKVRQRDLMLRAIWKSLKDDLLNVADKSYDWIKGPPRHKVT